MRFYTVTKCSIAYMDTQSNISFYIIYSTTNSPIYEVCQKMQVLHKSCNKPDRLSNFACNYNNGYKSQSR